jgi:acyl-CoA thioesterase II
VVALDALLGALDLSLSGPDQYEAGNAETGAPVIFGGQLLAQSVVAALRADDGDKRVKTIHTVFARGGSPDAPVEIHVDRMHRGRAFASSTVSISQGEALCARSLVLLSADEPDFVHHADPAPEAGGPLLAAPVGDGDSSAFEIRFVGDVDISDPDLVGPPDLDVWVRVPDAPADDGVAQALLAYISDGFLIGTAMRPHAGVGQAQAHVTVATSVVSHTLTFHRPFAMRDWLLLAHHSDFAGGGRCHGRASVFEGDALVATYVQDGMLRPVATPAS